MKFRNRQGAWNDRPLKSGRKGKRQRQPLTDRLQDRARAGWGRMKALGSPDAAAGAQEMLHQPTSTWKHLDLQSDLKTACSFSLWSLSVCALFEAPGRLVSHWSPYPVWRFLWFSDSSDGKESVWNAGDPGSIPGSGMSPGEGSGDPLQRSCLENPADRGAWGATVHGVAKSQTRLSDWHTRTVMELSLEVACSLPQGSFPLHSWFC